VGGSLQKIVVLGIALSAFSGAALAGMPGSAQPSESVPLGGGWRARLFVTPPAVETRKVQPGVDARLSRYLGKGMTLSLDMKNLFDRPDQGPPVNPFEGSPRAGRGLGIQLRKTF
jgi:hypothetical protein